MCKLIATGRGNQTMISISASILSADPAYIGRDLLQAIEAGATSVHVDVMDGYYVQNMTFGPALIHSLAKLTSAPICVHLEVGDPDRIAPLFYDTPCHSIVFQTDACHNPIHLLREIKAAGKCAGVGIGPAFGTETAKHILHHVEEVIVMSEEPGYAGQKFEASVYEKLRELKAMMKERGLEIPISVDGGVNAQNAAALIEAGTDILICGSSVFNGNIPENTKKILHALD